MQIIEDEFYTSQDILEIFKIHNQTLKNWRKRKVIPFIKITKKKIVYPKNAITLMLDKNFDGNL